MKTINQGYDRELTSLFSNITYLYSFETVILAKKKSSLVFLEACSGGLRPKAQVSWTYSFRTVARNVLRPFISVIVQLSSSQSSSENSLSEAFLWIRYTNTC